MMRLLIFESHPVQYHAPVYRELHRLCREAGRGGVHVVYATDSSIRGRFDPGFNSNVAWDEPLLDGYPATVLNSENGVPLSGFNSLTGKGIFGLLRRERPDAVLLTGLVFRFDWAAYFAAVCLRIPIWLRTETQDEARARGPFKSLLRSMFYRAAYAPVGKALVIGKLNASHYTRHGLGAARQVFSPYCVVDRFADASPSQLDDVRRQARAGGGFDAQTTVLLFCGKLQYKKNPDLLIEALAALRDDERKGFGLLFVGSGEREPELRRAAAALKDVNVRFAGFKNQTELGPYYLAADTLVLPSRQLGETWGLVVNEALLAGRGVIVSKHAGCRADFEELPGVTVFDGTCAGLVNALRRKPAAASATAQREFMLRYSIRAAALGIASAMGLPREEAGAEQTAGCALKPCLANHS